MGTIIGSVLAMAFFTVVIWGCNEFVRRRYGRPRPKLAAGLMLLCIIFIPIIVFGGLLALGEMGLIR